MKPYKILRPEKPLWHNKTLEVSITEKKTIRLPLKLIRNCHPIPRDGHIAKNIRIVRYE
jgi:hypothetical protein